MKSLKLPSLVVHLLNQPLSPLAEDLCLVKKTKHTVWQHYQGIINVCFKLCSQLIARPRGWLRMFSTVKHQVMNPLCVGGLEGGEQELLFENICFDKSHKCFQTVFMHSDRILRKLKAGFSINLSNG